MFRHGYPGDEQLRTQAEIRLDKGANVVGLPFMDNFT